MKFKVFFGSEDVVKGEFDVGMCVEFIWWFSRSLVGLGGGWVAVLNIF